MLARQIIAVWSVVLLALWVLQSRVVIADEVSASNTVKNAVEELQRRQLEKQYRDGGNTAVLPPATDVAAVAVRWRKAIMNDDVTTLSRLLQAAADRQQLAIVKTENHKTALMIASKLGEQTLFDQLLQLGADISAVTTTGGTPVMFASLGGHRTLVQRLVDLGADVDAQGANGWSSLTIAAAKGYTALADDLLELGADINAVDVYGWTPMMRAVDNRHRDTVKRLLDDRTVLLGHQDEGGNTALHYAAANLDLVLIRLLLRQGADAGVRNHKGQSPRDVAATRPRNAAVLQELGLTDNTSQAD